MPGRLYLRSLVAVMALVGAACTPPAPPISLQDGTVRVQNQSAEEWRNVRIVVNHHFGGGAASLPPDGVLNAPLSRMQTGLGQKFDRARQSVFRVEVTATTAGGEPVRLLWPEDADDPRK